MSSTRALRWTQVVVCRPTVLWLRLGAVGLGLGWGGVIILLRDRYSVVKGKHWTILCAGLDGIQFCPLAAEALSNWLQTLLLVQWRNTCTSTVNGETRQRVRVQK